MSLKLSLEIYLQRYQRWCIKNKANIFRDIFKKFFNIIFRDVFEDNAERAKEISSEKSLKLFSKNLKRYFGDIEDNVDRVEEKYLQRYLWKRV